MKNLVLGLFLFTLFSCQSHTEQDRESHKETARDFKYINIDASNCGMSDGSHEATVEYENPTTGYSQKYTLEIQVENCQVIEIDFPKGGWLDMHHIDPTEIDDNGDADLTDDKGRNWHIHFDSDEKGEDKSDRKDENDNDEDKDDNSDN